MDETKLQTHVAGCAYLSDVEVPGSGRAMAAMMARWFARGACKPPTWAEELSTAVTMNGTDMLMSGDHYALNSRYGTPPHTIPLF